MLVLSCMKRAGIVEPKGQEYKRGPTPQVCFGTSSSKISFSKIMQNLKVYCIPMPYVKIPPTPTTTTTTTDKCILSP